MEKELSTKEMIVLLDNAEKELSKAKKTLDEVMQELNKTYGENKRLQDNLKIANYLLTNLNKRNEELEYENKFFKERWI